MVARPRSASSSETSHPTVSRPARTHTCAMPAPMVPRPTTPTRLMSTRASLDLLDHGRDRLALADAHGGDPVALAAPVELGEQRGRDARARRAKRVAERDASAVRVHVACPPALVQAGVGQELEHDR